MPGYREDGGWPDLAAAVSSARDAPVWGFQLRDDYRRDGRREFQIVLQTVADAADVDPGTTAGTNLTPTQINAALAAERADHPDTYVWWALTTRLALRAWHGGVDEAAAWHALTGERITMFTRFSTPQPERRRNRRSGGSDSEDAPATEQSAQDGDTPPSGQDGYTDGSGDDRASGSNDDSSGAGADGGSGTDSGSGAGTGGGAGGGVDSFTIGADTGHTGGGSTGTGYSGGDGGGSGFSGGGYSGGGGGGGI